VEHYQIRPQSLLSLRERAQEKAENGIGPQLVTRLREGKKLSDDELAALFLSPGVETSELLSLAAELRGDEKIGIETFCPLYITNECDAECVMCGMRRFNQSLTRETATEATIKEQLEILARRGIRGVALLTGEYRHGSMRSQMLSRTNQAIRDAIEQGFQHILINVGSIEESEYASLLAGTQKSEDDPNAPRITMCTFQETYDTHTYQKFMGDTPENPRADFNRRLLNFDRAAEAGMRSANPGILVGLNPDLAHEILALLDHCHYLSALGMTTYVSLPRLRKANGAEHRAGVGDDEFCRLVAVLSFGLPEAKVVISTRETPAIQQRLLPIISVLTPGSPGVAPYTMENARFESDASQVEVADLRPFEEILGDCIQAGAIIDGYEPIPLPGPPR
jgi:3-methyl-2-indolic acid synthase